MPSLIMSPHEGGGGWPGGVMGIPPGPFGSGKSLFGDGSYSGNIIQGGSVLQPQAYTLYSKLALTAGMFSTSMGTSGGSWATYICDGLTANDAIYCGSSGQHVTIDYGTPVSAGKVRVYTDGAVASQGQYRIQYSDDGSTWSNTDNTLTNWSGGNVYTAVTWTPVGAHRYWRILSTAVPSNTPWWREVELYSVASLQNCIVITGAATVAPDATTGAAVYTAENIVVDGGSLSPTTNCKGLIGFVSGSVRLVNGGRIHIDKLGKAGNFGNLTVLDLVPQSIKRKLKNSLASYVVLGEGAAGAPRKTNSGGGGLAGSAAGAMQTGGGATGGNNGTRAGAGGSGGPCCGGAGSGGSSGISLDAGSYGGPGTAGVGGYQEAGGAGDPVGAGIGGATAGKGPGGGLLMLITALLSVASGCIISADGAGGGDSGYGRGGGGAGGGNVTVVTLPGGYINNGTVRANGGAGGLGTSGDPGGPGGAGSVNTFTV